MHFLDFLVGREFLRTRGMLQLLLAVSIIAGGGAQAAQNLVEVPLEKIFIPAVGFDDNDNVEAVLAGELPNPCFTLAYSVVQPTSNENSRSVKQYAWKNEEGACSTGDLIDDPVPFTATVSLGTLRSGKYELRFKKTAAGNALRSFNVEESKTNLVDNFEYAVVRGIDVIDATFEGAEVRAVISGLVTNTCSQIALDAKTNLVEDVFIILPRVETKSGETCHRTMKPFRREISLGSPVAGNYLLHARSRDGKAMYRPLLIWPKQ